LRADGERIRRQMQEVAVGHYRAFISAADAVQNITHEITAVDEHLKTLVSFKCRASYIRCSICCVCAWYISFFLSPTAHWGCVLWNVQLFSTFANG